ncbi:MFS transporter [Pontibacter qinzhouensis]|uniref:MFS transporter n=1 Tax=Pontibacter qinzhouensis TaxID=2603253 RepID=A0A5C8J3D5_9BACT|nr:MULTISPECIES: MFS transporter [Pontibacter]TXK31136.1 MFS transporter [Pontibacter qinzhouensis]
MGSKIRWFILGLVFLATGLNFLDRQVLSMTIIKIQDEFNISDVEYGWVNTSFLISYAIMFTVGGRLIDRIGGKAGLALSVGVWSVANSLHGVMTNFHQLLAFRFLLGVGEGGCFPGAAKTVYEWFGKKERALANGIAIGGSAIGAVLAPPVTILISNSMGWRWSFAIPGLVGIVWVLVWMLVPWRKKATKEQPVVVEQEQEKAPKIPFLTLLKNKEVLVFILIRFLLDPVFYFLMFWVPKYLNQERGVSFERVGELFWIPFLALGISNIMGGWFSDRLIARGLPVNSARKWVMGIAAAITLVAPLIAWVSSVEVAILLMAVLMLAHGLWITNYITAISDVFGRYATSTVVGLSGTAGAVSGMVMNPLIGMVIQDYSYGPLWIISGIMYPLAFVLLAIFIPKIKAVDFSIGQKLEKQVVG